MVSAEQLTLCANFMDEVKGRLNCIDHAAQGQTGVSSSNAKLT